MATVRAKTTVHPLKVLIVVNAFPPCSVRPASEKDFSEEVLVAGTPRRPRTTRHSCGWPNVSFLLPVTEYVNSKEYEYLLLGAVCSQGRSSTSFTVCSWYSTGLVCSYVQRQRWADAEIWSLQTIYKKFSTLPFWVTPL